MNTSPVVPVRCPVCGEAPGHAAWRCERCETPHHTECAEYFGGCAIFGCRDGHLPARLEIESWPAAVQALDRLLAVRRYQTYALVALALCPGFGLFVIPFFLGVVTGSAAATQGLTNALVIAAAFVFGPAYCVFTLLAERRLRALRTALGASPEAHLDLPRFRLAFRAPVRGRRSPIAWLVRAVGWFASVLVAGFAIGMSHPWITLGLGVVTLLIVAAGHALDTYAADQAAFVTRVEATFTPLLTEEKPPR